MKSLFRTLLFGTLLFSLPGISQTSIAGEPGKGSMPVVKTLGEIAKESALVIRQNQVKIREELSTKRTRRPRQSAEAQAVASFPKSTSQPIIAQQNTQGLHSNFAALHTFETSGVVVTPPDCMGEVGPTQVCIASNNRLKWYNKPTVCDAPLTTSTTSGSLALGGAVYSVYIEDFFQTVRNGSEVTDPHVHYDRLSQRWFIVAINTEAASNRIMLAVSNGPTISDITSFSFFFFNHDNGAAFGSPDAGQFCDYPTLGVDRNALYVGGLIFDATAGTFIGSSAYVIRKSSVTGSGPLSFTAFRGVGTTTTGIFCPQGVQNDDPNATLGYFVGVSAQFFGVLNYLVVNNPGSATPSVTSGSFSVPATEFPIEVPAQGSTADLDAGDDRLLNARLVRNKNNGTSTIWTAHNIGVTNTGVAVQNQATRTATRWYGLTANGANITLGQSGTLFDNTAFGPRNYWFGDISGTGQGHAVLGASVAGTSAYANAVIAGRYASTAAGSLFAPVNASDYAANYNLQGGEAVQRWGDYSQTALDPSDDMTLWTFQQFTSGTDRWAVRAIQIKAPPPAAVSNMTSIACTADRTIDVTVNGTAGANFAGYFDPGADAGGPGYARRLAVTSTGGVTISNLAYVSPTQLAFRLNYAAATLGSTQTLTITNPDCQSVTFDYTLPTGCSPLPVNWLAISAAWTNGQAQVTWKVSGEKDLKHYVVERSADGRQFAPIGTVLPRNAEQASYTYTDANAGSENYYRIKQVDIDGAFTYSATVALFKQSIRSLSVYPNPARSNVRLLLPDNSGQIRLLDLQGKVLWSTAITSNVLNLETSRYARGVYMLEYLRPNGKAEQHKLILR